MAGKVKVWFDAEADFLEVKFSDAAGFAKATRHDAVMERVDPAERSLYATLISLRPVSAERTCGLSCPAQRARWW
jgi:hypothetical protein